MSMLPGLIKFYNSTKIYKLSVLRLETRTPHKDIQYFLLIFLIKLNCNQILPNEESFYAHYAMCEYIQEPCEYCKKDIVR